jgi:hypothetical protein
MERKNVRFNIRKLLRGAKCAAGIAAVDQQLAAALCGLLGIA